MLVKRFLYFFHYFHFFLDTNFATQYILLIATQFSVALLGTPTVSYSVSIFDCLCFNLEVIWRLYGL